MCCIFQKKKCSTQTEKKLEHINSMNEKVNKTIITSVFVVYRIIYVLNCIRYLKLNGLVVCGVQFLIDFIVTIFINYKYAYRY